VFGIRKDLDYTKVTDKRIWHPFSLQSLATKDFVRIVNKILAGRHGLLTYRDRADSIM
jgi:hypothetical protein